MAKVDLDQLSAPNVQFSRELSAPPYGEGERVQTPDGPGVVLNLEGSRMYSDGWRMGVILDTPRKGCNPAYYWPRELKKV